MCVCVFVRVCMYICTRECRCPRMPEVGLDSFELEFQVLVSHPILVPGTQSQSERAASDSQPQSHLSSLHFLCMSEHSFTNAFLIIFTEVVWCKHHYFSHFTEDNLVEISFTNTVQSSPTLNPIYITPYPLISHCP